MVAAPRTKVPTSPRTGFKELDRLHPVLVPGTVQVVVGSPGVGVSSWLLAIARHVAGQQRFPVVYMTGESPAALRRRLVLQQAVVGWSRLRTSDLHDDERSATGRAMAAQRTWPLRVVEAAEPTAARRAVSSQLRELRAAGPGLVVLDDPTGPATCEAKVPDPTAWMRVGRELAEELGAVALVAARATPLAPDGRDLTTPTVYSRLNRWATMQRYCDALWVVHRDEHYDTESPRRGAGEIHLLLNRLELPRLRLSLTFQEHRARWGDVAGAR